uniref:Tc1-like transposase DDE domain-containing protein n=1 Tax=Scylla olivacea TaxID=85551 RepID=A0A0P4W325_SCYOL
MEGHSANSPSRAVLHSQARELVFRVNRYFIQEKANREPLLPLTQARKRTAHATGVSEATVKRICSKDNRICDTVPQNTPVFTSPKKTRSAFVTNLDDFDKCVVRRTILGFYVRKEIPTLHKVKEELREKIEFRGSHESLRKIIREIGFRYKRVDGRKFLMERSDVQAARADFLQEMQRLKISCESFVYLDETWVNQNYTVPKCWVDCTASKATGIKVPTGKGSRLIILHAGTKHGFVKNAELIFQAKNDGDYHNQMTAIKFEEWFRNQLLPNIPRNSVIVMDNAAYHSRLIEKMPTQAWTKGDIKEWLTKKGEQPSHTLLKSQLLILTKKYNTGKKYFIDTIAREAGHRVVRLPPYHCQYNPIELIWAQVKKYIGEKNNYKLADLKLLVKQSLEQVTPCNWMNAVKHTDELQAKDAEMDQTVDRVIDPIIINPEDDTSDESDS